MIGFGEQEGIRTCERDKTAKQEEFGSVRPPSATLVSSCPKCLQVIDVDFVKKHPYAKSEIIKARKNWLVKQRKIDKQMIPDLGRKAYNKAYMKAYMKTDKYKAYKKAYQKAYRIRKRPYHG